MGRIGRVPKNIGVSKKFWSTKNLDIKLLCTKECWVPKILCSKKIQRPEKVWVQKIFVMENFVSRKNLGAERI